ncbi:MAG TPA: hypothetical protein VH183_07715 [Burkholderiaceae bacterium]|jgi:hypothetical protein|nr:hypothetical protein [Burkholderiaceae bacterium]
MKKFFSLFGTDDALLVLLIAVPTMFAVARYVESAAEASAIVLAHQSRQSTVVKASPARKIHVAQSAAPAR